MNAKYTVRSIIAAIMAVSLGLSGPALAGDRHHGGYKHGYSSGHGYKHHRGHGNYGRGYGYKRHRGHQRYRDHGHRGGHHYGHRGYPRSYYYYDNDHDDLLLGLILGGFAGYALNPGYRY